MIFVMGFRVNDEGTRVGIGFMGYGPSTATAKEDMYDHVEEYYGERIVMHDIDIYSARKTGLESVRIKNETR